MKSKVLAALVLFTIFLSLSAGTAEAVTYYYTGLWAGQNIYCGWLSVEIDGDTLSVTYYVFSGWTIAETHLYVGIDPPTKSAPGQFPFKTPIILPDGSHQYIVSLSSIGAGPGDELYIAAHATVTNCLQEETAWAGCEDYSVPFGRGWASYFIVSVHL